MVELKYESVSHDHKAFLKNAQKREGFSKAYNDLEEEYTLVREKGVSDKSTNNASRPQESSQYQDRVVARNTKQ